MAIDYSAEGWKTVPSLPGLEASTLGRIRVKWHKPAGRRPYGGNPSPGRRAADGRMRFNYQGKTYKVARLVCEAFHGHAPEGRPLCMHINENPSDNRPENLTWGTAKENLNFPGFLSGCSDRWRGERNPRVKAMRRKEATQ